MIKQFQTIVNDHDLLDKIARLQECLEGVEQEVMEEQVQRAEARDD